MKISIHQPNYLPWPGFFHKLLITDKMILLDMVQYDDKSFSNRNRIKTSNGAYLLSVPVRLPRFDLSFKEVQIDPDNTVWKRKHWRTIQLNYQKTTFFNELKNDLQAIYESSWTRLLDLNITLIRLVMDYLEIRTDLILASDISTAGKGNELLIDICRSVGADTFLSGAGAHEYILPELYKDADIDLQFQQFRVLPYNQRYGEFISSLSIIDMLFNVGKSAKALILEGGRQN